VGTGGAACGDLSFAIADFQLPGHHQSALSDLESPMVPMAQPNPQHAVLIAGGAVAGSEAAFQFARRGIVCIVLEQNDRPYGKIEDGLPRWHVNLRLQEEKKIDDKLARPGVHFVPRTKLGRDLSLEDVLGWGLSAVVLATGAWRDRPLPVPGIDQFVGRGFYYQNPLVHWFNHYPEPGYRGPEVELADGSIVVGGGLASLDVVKILMLETVARALAAHGHGIGLYELERRGIKKLLEELGLTLGDVGLRGCTLFYRRRVEDMPLAEAPDDAAPQQMEKTRATRRKLLQNFAEKYLFNFRDQRVPVGYLAEGDRLVGLRLASTEVMDGRAVTLPGTEQDAAAPLVVSSIGSIPEPIPGMGMRGEVYRIREEKTGEVEGLPGVFAVGNAVTGKGNILASLKHGRVVSQHMLEHYLLGTASGYEEVLAEGAGEARDKARAVAERLAGQAPLPGDRVAAILTRVQSLQERVGYPGDYRAWIERVRPPQV
jgi:NADPH-dependent glutamate synthase beta subunit-like oxidoreductase